ncbi:MAG: site-2 protease family protein [Candidatus Eremiobacteraeota bacterium]|nr:site-2 protease family protein [Candidatus Eremiobacteraeota bacterium]MBC5821751.1 site-2 protease family protein [Candidatus Eremiobacteraeota bacterium]
MTVSVPLAFLLAPSALDGLWKVVVFLLMLSVLVVLHEAGHFVLARRNGVRVNDFAVGFGPTLLKWTSPRSGTNYRLNLLPIGGYCAMQGEDGGKNEAEQQREFRQNSASAAAGEASARPSKPQGLVREAAAGTDDNFQAKPAWRRLSIIVAGPLSNFLLAYVIMFAAAVSVGIASSNISPQIGILMPNSPAVKAGFQTGDHIIAIDGKRYARGDDVVAKIHASAGRRLHITIARHGVQQTIAVTPMSAQVGGKREGRIGFTAIPTFERVGVIAAFPIAAIEFKNLLVGQVGGYVALFSHFKENAGALQGPIGMERAASTLQDLGWGPYLDLAATISIALGLINLLPFPALDGGRGVFIVAEMLRGRPVEPEKEALVHFTGFAVLMALMVFVAFHDISNIVSGKGVL